MKKLKFKEIRKDVMEAMKEEIGFCSRCGNPIFDGERHRCEK